METPKVLRGGFLIDGVAPASGVSSTTLFYSPADVEPAPGAYTAAAFTAIFYNDNRKCTFLLGLPSRKLPEDTVPSVPTTDAYKLDQHVREEFKTVREALNGPWRMEAEGAPCSEAETGSQAGSSRPLAPIINHWLNLRISQRTDPSLKRQ